MANYKIIFKKSVAKDFKNIAKSNVKKYPIKSTVWRLILVTKLHQIIPTLMICARYVIIFNPIYH